MNPFLSNLHAFLKSAIVDHRGATHMPSDVPRWQHKSYDRMEQIPLPTPQVLDMSLVEALQKRDSYNGGTLDPLSLERYSTLLGHSLAIRPDGKYRNYPSGGSLYPVETYLIGTIEGMPSAIYHYNPSKHSLEKLWDTPEGFVLKKITRSQETLIFSAALIFTTVWTRSSAKYGDLAYPHILIEAGHMAENVVLTAAAMGIQARPFSGFKDEEIANLFDLKQHSEQMIYSIVLSI